MDLYQIRLKRQNLVGPELQGLAVQIALCLEAMALGEESAIFAF